MPTFKEANRVRTALKIKLSQFGWYNGSHTFTVTDGFGIVISVSRIDGSVRKQISPVIDGVNIKMEIE